MIDRRIKAQHIIQLFGYFAGYGIGKACQPCCLLGVFLAVVTAKHDVINGEETRDMDAIISEMFMVAEGVKSAPAVLALAQEYQVEMPMVRDVNRVLNGEATATRVFRSLLRLETGAEWEPG